MMNGAAPPALVRRIIDNLSLKEVFIAVPGINFFDLKNSILCIQRY